MRTVIHNRGAVSTPIIIIVVVIVVIIGTILVLNSRATNQQNAGVEPELQPAPAFALQDYNGNTVQLSDSHGKVRVLNSWATWCPFCVHELPDFALLQEEFGDQIVVIAINREESLEQGRSYTDDLGISEKFTFLLDPDDTFYRDTGGFGMPVTLFVDTEGNTVITRRGPLSLDEMRKNTLTVLDSETITN